MNKSWLTEQLDEYARETEAVESRKSEPVIERYQGVGSYGSNVRNVQYRAGSQASNKTRGY
jgi:hypothetical protein